MTLSALPKGNDAAGDTLLLILLGYYENGDTAVFSPTLSKAAKLSGLNLDRLDRTIKTLDAYVNTSGAHRGTKYSLNNRGIDKAKEIAHRVFE